MKQLHVMKARPRRVNTTDPMAVLILLASAHVISGFIPPLPRVAAAKSKQNLAKKNPTFAAATKDSHRAIVGSTSDDDIYGESDGSIQELSQGGLDAAQSLPIAAATSLAVLAANPDPALAAVLTSPVASGLWAYAHYLSILVIVGCLTAERVIVKADMATVEEDQIVKIDLVYGLMAALLIISGFARATNFGKGGDFYIHEPLFWAKMTFSGVWGGLSLFPSCECCVKRANYRLNESSIFQSRNCSWIRLSHIFLYNLVINYPQ